MIYAIGLLLISIFVAWAGGHLFIQGVGGMRKLLRISGLTAGLLVASISTSSPELFVGVSSAIRKIPEVSLGDVLGSNVVNIALIMGVFLLLSPKPIVAHTIRIKDVLISCAAPILALLLSLDGVLSKVDGLILLSAFALWLRWLIKEDNLTPDDTEQKTGTVMYFGIGLAMLVVAGYTFTESANDLAKIFEINLFIFSSIVVALGTSMPELVTSIIAIRTKQNDVAIGNLLGSNVFNSLGILGIVALIQPITVSPLIISVPVALAVIATLMVSHTTRSNMQMIGLILIGIYVLSLFSNVLLW